MAAARGGRSLSPPPGPALPPARPRGTGTATASFKRRQRPAAPRRLQVRRGTAPRDSPPPTSPGVGIFPRPPGLPPPAACSGPAGRAQPPGAPPQLAELRAGQQQGVGASRTPGTSQRSAAKLPSSRFLELSFPSLLLNNSSFIGNLTVFFFFFRLGLSRCRP